MEEIINYVMETPGNTNPNVLRSQLQGMVSSSGDGVLVVHNIDGTLDKTWKEINAAPFAILKSPLEEGGTGISTISFLGDESTYDVSFGDAYFVADGEDDYPVFVVPGGGGGTTRGVLK